MQIELLLFGTGSCLNMNMSLLSMSSECSLICNSHPILQSLAQTKDKEGCQTSSFVILMFYVIYGSNSFTQVSAPTCHHNRVHRGNAEKHKFWNITGKIQNHIWRACNVKSSTVSFPNFRFMLISTNTCTVIYMESIVVKIQYIGYNQDSILLKQPGVASFSCLSHVC